MKTFNETELSWLYMICKWKRWQSSDLINALWTVVAWDTFYEQRINRTILRVPPWILLYADELVLIWYKTNEHRTKGNRVSAKE